MAENAVVFPVCAGRDLEHELQEVMDHLLDQCGDSLICDQTEAYAIHVEYDRIRDILMEDREVWERWRSVYWKKKYNSYLTVYERLEESLKEPYMDRMQREFYRAMQTGQLDSPVFDETEWKEITDIIRRCDGASGVIRGIPVARKLAWYIPKPIRRVVLNAVKRIIKAKE